MRTPLARLITVLWIVCWASAALAQMVETRVALVIGNSRYTAVTPLPNPQRDATAVAQALRDAGFPTVQVQNDLSAEALRRALLDFSKLAEKADWAVVYYAGHGVEVGGQNYLIPTDARLNSDRDVSFEAVPLDQELTSIEGAKKLRLVILDACRDNPFLQQMTRTVASRSIGRGLARIEPEGGTLVAYAAKSGQVAFDGEGQNSPFVTALVKHLQVPGLEINMLFRAVRDEVLSATSRKQEPFVYGSLPSESFFFVPATLPPALPVPSRPVLPQPAISVLIRTCDELAAQPDDPDRPTAVKGFELEQINSAEAIRVCRAAVQAEPRNRRALFQLGRGFDASGAYVEAKTWYEEAASLGHVLAMNRLGFLHLQGEGVQQDYATARRWYEKAAALGDTAAMSNLGVLHERGQGVSQDYEEARRWYEKAAALGSATAMHNLGVLYRDGRSVQQDYTEARRWFEKAAALSIAAVMQNLGFLYRDGQGVQQDYAEARRWFEKAAALGDTGAMAGIGVLYGRGLGVSQDYAEARRWYEKAAALGNATAMINLGSLYDFGLDVMQDYAEARRWYEKAAALGDVSAKTNLAKLRGTRQ